MLIKDFDILEILYDGVKTLIYKAVRKQDLRPVIIKIKKNPEDIFLLRHEYDILMHSYISGIANVLTLEYKNERGYLVHEDVQGVVLNSFIENRKLSEQEFITIALNATYALKSIHEREIIHKDIKPANMLIDPETLQIWFIDFGISETLWDSFRLPAKGLAGTLEYISPEQTGRVSLPVDHRSDLYSLGATFYFLLTGEHPYKASSGMELIHSHIALTPSSPADIENVNPILSDIVMRLIQKAPEDRYQSAASLAYDLSKCLSALKSYGKVLPFYLGSNDMSAKLKKNYSLYGKEASIRQIKTIYDRIANQKAEIVMLKGPAGSGKTTLSYELKKHVIKSEGIFLHGEFEYEQISQPFYAISKAFQHYFDFLKNRGIDLSGLVNSLAYSLGDNIRSLLDIFPFLEEYFDKIPPLPDLSFSENLQRMQMTFVVFLKAITSSAYPLVLFIDNVQSADIQSLQLFINVLREGDISSLLIILCMRSKESQKNPQLQQAIAIAENSSIKITEINFSYLSLSNVHNIIEDIFGTYDSDDTYSLAQYIYSVTEGRPFDVADLLESLWNQKLLTFDSYNKKYIWDIEKIQHTHFSVGSENRFQALITALSPTARELLDFLCIYTPECPKKDMMDTEGLNELIDKEIIVKNQNESYMFRDSLMRAYCLNIMPASKRKQLNYIIGNILYKDYSESSSKRNHNYMLIADHLNAAKDYVKQPEEKHILVKLNEQAGIKCYLTGDISKAVLYYIEGLELMQPEPFSFDYNLAAEVILKLCLCYQAQGDDYEFSRISRYFLSSSPKEADVFKYYNQSIDQFNKLKKYGSAILIAKDYLEGLGVLYEEQPDPEATLASAKEYFETVIAVQPVSLFLDREPAEDEKDYRLCTILTKLSDALKHNDDPQTDYYNYYVCRLAFTKGVSEGFEIIYRNAAVKALKKNRIPKSESLFKCSLSFADKYMGTKALTYTYYGYYLAHWIYPVDEIFEIYKSAKNSAITEGHISLLNFSDIMILNNRFFMSQNLNNLLDEINLAIENASKMSFDYSYHILIVIKQAVKCLMGKTISPSSFNDNSFNEEEFLAKNQSETEVIGYFYVYKIITLCINGYTNLAVPYFEKAAPYAGALSHTILSFFYNFFQSYAYLHSLDEDNREEYLAVIENNQKQLLEWSVLCPENYRKYYLFINFEKQRILNHSSKLIVLYTELSQLSYSDNEHYILGLIHSSMQSYWEKSGNQEYAAHHQNKSFNVFNGKCFYAKAAYLSAEIDTNTHSSDSISPLSNPMANKPFTNKALDAETLLSIMMMLNKDLNLLTIAKNLLSFLIQNSGASKGFIVTVEDNQPTINAVYYSTISSGNLSANMLPIPLGQAREEYFPIKIVEHVVSKKAMVSMNYPSEKYLYYNDIYFKVSNPESFICMPIPIKEKCVGAIYLENSTLSGVFSAERLSIIKTIAIQSGVIIQNAVYYNELNNYASNVEEQLKKHSTLLNSIIAGIAHEINTPIGVCVTVISHMQTISDNIKKLYEQQKLSRTAMKGFLTDLDKGLNIAWVNIERAINLIQNFKKVSTSQGTEIFEEINFYSTVSSIVEYIRPVIKKKVSNIEIIGDHSFSFNSCPGALTQIFTNLIMNSVHHGFENRTKESCKISIMFEKDGNDLKIIYSDNGIGMTPEQLEKLFQPFYTTKRKNGGSGLGTHIILSLVTQVLKGKANCSSIPGKGTDYLITLPITISP